MARRSTNKALAIGEEKRYARQKEITATDYHGQVTLDSGTICQVFVEHYRELLGKGRDVEDGFTNCFLSTTPKLDGDVRVCLEGLISISEIEKAIDDLSTRKSPGPDGLGASF